MTQLPQIDQSNLSIWQHQYTNPASNFIEAEKILKESKKLRYVKGIAYSHLNMAKACFLQSKNKEAFELIILAIPYFYENNNEPGYAWILNLQGNLLESLGDYEKGLELCLKALKKAKDNSDADTEAEASSVLGLIYSRLCNFNKAIEFYRMALTIRENLGDEASVASSLNRIGMIHRLTKEYDEALIYYHKSLEIRERKKLTGAIPWTMLGLANTYEEMERFPEALEFYSKGDHDGDKRCRLQCKIGTGRIYSRLGENEKAEAILAESLEMAKELQAKQLVTEIHSALAVHYERIGLDSRALASYKHYQHAREKVMSEEAQNRLRNVEISHAIEKSEQEKEIFRLKHIELKTAYDIIEEKNKQITSSITYARYIQQAILPEPSNIRGLAERCFILYLPKDIISGDFYWLEEKNGQMFFLAADCTGHGVPGALMSMLGISLLNEIINEKKITDAGIILDTLRLEIIKSLHQNGKEKTKDGMDISLCILDEQEKKMQFAGAFNSLYIARNSSIIEVKADHMPIGISENINIGFTRNDIDVNKGDMIYLLSDGYADQFGGPEGKKFKYKPLTALFLELQALPIQEQKAVIEKRFLDWKGENDQVDDVLILGFRI
jgi:serine phosphatase RsbU (regulator of sigma subunit)